MNVRWFGAVLLGVVGVIPLLVAGGVMNRRVDKTVLEQVSIGNRQVADRAASRLNAYVRNEVDLLRTLSASLAPAVAASPEQVQLILRNYHLLYPHLRLLYVVGTDPERREVATSDTRGRKTHQNEPAVETALQGKIFCSRVKLSKDLALLMKVGVPLGHVGEVVGAVVAEIDLIGIWPAVQEVKVGQRGFARLVAEDGTLIAHGDAEEGRSAFLYGPDPFVRLVLAEQDQAAHYLNRQGIPVLGVASPVAELHWTVIVEQPESEVRVASARMSKDLLYIVVVAIVAAIILGILLGQAPVRGIEAMKRHMREVARGNLDARLALPWLEEFRSLAQALNEMTGQLKSLQEEIKSKERLSTFARVAAGLAHDLQPPIESIRAACDLATKLPDDPGVRALLRSANENHMPRLVRFVHDLRRVAREGTIPLEVVSVDPAGLARRVTGVAAGEPKWQGVEFAVEGQVERIWADESLLERAIINLVGNAADACVGRKPPGGRVTVRLRDDLEAQMLSIEVVDTGVGIDPAVLRDLGNDFRSTKRNSGVGLGLAVARHIATAHGGAIKPSSELGKGSNFCLSLPRRAVAGRSA